MHWHRHRWIEYARTYAPPYNMSIDRHVGDESVILHVWERAAFGVTTILFRCTHTDCGKLKTVEMLGRVLEPDPLERMAR